MAKTCSRECSAIYRIERMKKLVSKRCRRCNEEFAVQYGYQYQTFYCSNTCRSKSRSEAKTGAKNPHWSGGIAFRKKPTYSLKMRRHNHACIQFRKVFVDENGYEFCEICQISNVQIAFKFDAHHIYYVSKHPNNENIHHPKNLILVCRSCHRKFHGGEYKELFRKIESERGLKELFEHGRIVKDPPVFNYRTKTIVERDRVTGRYRRLPK